MLLYYLFWMFMGFTLHVYIIFRTNLLTRGPARIAVFLPISVFRRKGISNGVQLTSQFLTIFYGPKEDPGVKELGQESPGLPTRVGGAPTPLGVGPCLVDNPETPLT